MVLRNQPTAGGRDKSCPTVSERYHELGIRISISITIQEAGITGRARHKPDLAGNVLTCNKVKGKEIVTNVGNVLGTALRAISIDALADRYDQNHVQNQ